HISFNDYKATLATIGRTSYNQDLDPQEIVNFKTDGATPADFYHDDLKVWDYKRWALSSVEAIEKDIKPLREQLITHDGELIRLHQKLKKDSVSVRTELTELKKKDFSALLKIDAQPLPIRVFDMKSSEIDYGSQIVEGKALKDSANIVLRLNAVKKQLDYARHIDTLTARLA